ncbi:MAG TPA: class I SAM-dependent methyltransferase [Pyrinomonadaceae bacterium]|nr:class I SAM-dependent methyltransferase [Pyrinomonadaceae bacterium]
MASRMRIAGTDAYGAQLLAQYYSRAKTFEIIERDDGYIATGSDPGLYFREYRDWSWPERRALGFAKGRVLDIGCGAGRHSLYLQGKGFSVTGIDASPGAVKVCKLRGLSQVLVRPIARVDKFKPATFDTVLLLGNNFGLFASAKSAKVRLRKLARITSTQARIIAGTRNPYVTDDPKHHQYHRRNRRRGRMAGQIRMRIRFEDYAGEWFDYLLVSPDEMKGILAGTGWQIERLISPEAANYFAVIRKEVDADSHSHKTG